MSKESVLTVKNVNFGEIKVSETQKITIPDGLFGFEQFKEYYLADVEISPFLLLQSKEEAAIGFIVTEPFLFFGEYEFDLDDSTIKYLDIADKDDILILVIVTLSENVKEITANLLGPLVINRKTHKGVQYIINTDKYSTKHKIFGEG